MDAADDLTVTREPTLAETVNSDVLLRKMTAFANPVDPYLSLTKPPQGTALDPSARHCIRESAARY